MLKSTKKNKEIYLDYAASILPNPSSIHKYGVEAKRNLENARMTVAKILSAHVGEIIFTSGGTESNNLAIQGMVYAPEEQGFFRSSEKIPRPFKKVNSAKNKMNQDVKKILKIVTFFVFFLFIVIYAFFRSRDLILGVQIKNVNIVDGAKVTNSILRVTGNAKNAINLTLNGREISIDQEGNFNETIALLGGYNIINIKAKDKFGYSDEKNYKLIY